MPINAYTIKVYLGPNPDLTFNMSARTFPTGEKLLWALQDNVKANTDLDDALNECAKCDFYPDHEQSHLRGNKNERVYLFTGRDREDCNDDDNGEDECAVYMVTVTLSE